MNILVDSSGRACVADFGLSAVNESKIACWTSNVVKSEGGTIRWQAPELNDPEIDHPVQNSKESDIYAWGCVCYEVKLTSTNQRLITSDIQIFTGSMPFYEIPREPTVMVRVGQGWRPKRPPIHGVHGYPWTLWGLTEAIWELMEDCWARNPSDRLVVQDIVARLSSVCKTDDRPAKVDMVPSSVRIQNSVSGEHSPSLDDVEPILSQLT